jgi:chemotaxis protein MotB
MRRKKHVTHENHERWLVSYADFITLLFAFFVVMFASSQTDRSKAQQVSDSVKKALEEGQIASAVAGILGGTVNDKGQGNAMLKGPGGTERNGKDAAEQSRLKQLLPSLEYLSTELKSEIETGKVNLKLQARGLVISLQEAAFFPSGEDTIDPATYASIGKIATAILKVDNPVKLEGHTDSVPIHNARFRSNWALSAARSLSMLVLMTEKYGIPQQRLAISGHADTVPVDTNDAPAGRARNRRVDIVILGENLIASEAAPAPEPSPAPAVKHAPGH